MTSQIPENTPEFETEALGPSIGERLRLAREEKRWSQAVAAEKLRFSVERVVEMEADDFTHSPALIYAKGYLRAYACLLGLSADALLSDFEALRLCEKITDKAPRTIVRQTDTPAVRHVRWVSYVIVFALLSLVILWWHSGNKGMDTTQSVTAEVPHFARTPSLSGNVKPGISQDISLPVNAVSAEQALAPETQPSLRVATDKG